MKSRKKQMEIMKNQLNKALEIVLNQKHRYENFKTKLYGYTWTCEDARKNNEIANGLLGAISNIECAIENMYI